MGGAEAGDTFQRLPESREGGGSSMSSAVIIFYFTAGTCIPHASSSLHTGGGACGHLTALFARTGLCACVLYQGGSQIQGAGRGERCRTRDQSQGRERRLERGRVGNGDVNGDGDGDGDGAGTRTGVEASERTQDRNGDGNGDRAGRVRGWEQE